MLRVLFLRLSLVLVFFFNDTATTEIYTLSLHDALPISSGGLLLLTRGRLSALWEKDGKALRTASYRAGMALGELPLMLERQRLLKLVADTPAVLLELSQDALEQLRTTMPGLDAKLMRNHSNEIGYRLCDLLETIRDLEGD